MEHFTIEEINLMCIYDTGTRSGLIAVDSVGEVIMEDAVMECTGKVTIR